MRLMEVMELMGILRLVRVEWMRLIDRIIFLLQIIISYIYSQSVIRRVIFCNEFCEADIIVTKVNIDPRKRVMFCNARTEYGIVVPSTL